MALYRRVGGICGSPISSSDDDANDANDIFAYDDKENAYPSAAASKKTTKKTKKKTAKRPIAAVEPPPPRKRAKATATTSATPRVLSKKELVRVAPQRFVEYLAEQLAPTTQTQLCEEFGVGQGTMARLPTGWPEVRQRRAFGEWATRLGFVASSVHRHLFRISSLSVEILLAELRTRVRIRSTSASFAVESDVSMNFEVDAEPEPKTPTSDSNSTIHAEETTPALASKRQDTESLQSFKKHFQQLDMKQLEMLSVSEHDRLLSTIRHEQIADAMEEVLARPSVRKERDRARRMSKLGRIAERRLSLVPMRPSVLPGTIMEDEEWDEDDDDDVDAMEEEDELLQASESIMEEGEEVLLEVEDSMEVPSTDVTIERDEDGTCEGAEGHQPEGFVTPRKSTPRMRTRRSSIGSVGTSTRQSIVSSAMATRRSSIARAETTPAKKTPGKPPLTPVGPTPRRSSSGKPTPTALRTPVQTPQKTPVRTPTRTPMRTPMRTPRRTSVSGIRRSPMAKAALADLKRWKFIGRNILGSVFDSGFLNIADLKAAFDVSKAWRDVSIPAYAWSVADYSTQSAIPDMDKLYGDCPRGHYLSDGAYKEVFKVYSTRHKRLEAVSVMDIRAIESTGNQHIVRQEVAHSLLLSELVRSRFLPHFVEIYDMFLARERPRTMKWGSAACRKPVDLLTGGRNLVDPALLPADATPPPDGLFQYIHMEFCDGGDIEDFIGLQENKLLPVHSVVIPFFFQMVFSIYSARERFQMRHCDIKLLNFFLKDISRKGLKCAEDEPLTAQYTIGNSTFNVQMPATFSYWVKLADYGTADSNVENLGKPVTLDQFTTLENTPVEFLLEGDQAQQSFAADTFSLGLCLLHLFTGSAPYEEILADVKCPPALLQELKRLWMSTKKQSPFTVLRRVSQDDSDDILIHTLYRYIVLFGLPVDNPSATRQFDRVWTILIKHLRPEDASDNQPARQSSRRAVVAFKTPPVKSAKDQFEAHRAQFSVAEGRDPVIQRARERMERVPGAQDLLLSLVAFNPSERPTMRRTFFHDMFRSLQVVSSDKEVLTRPIHYTVDCYAPDRIPVERLPDV